MIPCTTLVLKKESFKFASAHMTVFPDGTKEPLHGHNYRVEVEVQLYPGVPNLPNLIPFQQIKTPIQDLCDQWDEKVLIPERCPFLKLLQQTPEFFEFQLCQKHYRLPQDEILLLPLDTITTEALSYAFGSQLLAAIKGTAFFAKIQNLSVTVMESSGQGSRTQFPLHT